MNQSTSGQSAGTSSAQARPGAPLAEAAAPGQAARPAAAPYSGSVQARSGAQGQVSARGERAQASQPTPMRPAVDIFEDEGGVTLLADMPGVSHDRLEVRVDGDTLVIEGTAATPEMGEVQLLHGELLSPRYRRSFNLSRDLDAQKVEAQLKEGVLRLRIHKVEQAKPRRIQVQLG